MSSTVLSPNMSLPVPIVGQEKGPDYATDINNCMTILDQHNHTPGSGVMITPDAINWNSDLSANTHRLKAIYSAVFSVQTTPLTAVSPDIGALYVSGADLYYNDINGNQVRITQGGSVAGATGSISGLVSPASASYSAGSSTFVWQSNVNTAAKMDMGSIILRNMTALSFGLTVNPPNAMGADISITLPNPPASTQFMTMDSTGQIGVSIPTSLGITSSNLAANSVTTSKITDANVTKAKLSALGQQSGAPNSSAFTTSFVAMGGTATITTTGRPVFVTLAAGSSATANIDTTNSFGTVQILRDASVIFEYTIGGNATGDIVLPPSAISCIDESASAGTYAYTAKIKSNSASGAFANIKVLAYEL